MVALSTVRPGSSVRVLKLEGQPDVCRRLREMGFGENAVIRCLQAAPACVCQVHQSRVGLSSQLARHILVEPLAAAR
jgi:ferrous iron transport protein A